MPNVNPSSLRWARETAGLTPEEAVQKLDINEARGVAASDRLDALESGDEQPTRTMLVKMAKQYRRPLLTFYLRDIPSRGDRGEDFRTLPEPVRQTEAGWVDAVVRDIRARQALVRSSLEAAGEAQRLDFIGSMTRGDGVAAVVTSIEQTLSFDRDAFRRKAQLQGSFAYLRALTEAVGIFVILVDNLGSWHTTISVETFRGFALADDVAPFVAVNANDSPGAWSFTLVHELAHLWIGATGVSGGTAERAIEKFCNDVAGEFLLPRNEIVGLEVNEETPLDSAMERITEFAQAKNISSTMVAYKLHRAGAFSFERFQQIKAEYRQFFLARKAAEKENSAEKEGGPTYYVVRKHRVGTSLIRFVERMMHEGNLSTTKAGKVLGVGAHNVHALLEQGRPNHSI
jgi:Zn-dependent peptidase ImmA (M78 family)